MSPRHQKMSVNENFRVFRSLPLTRRNRMLIRGHECKKRSPCCKGGVQLVVSYISASGELAEFDARWRVDTNLLFKLAKSLKDPPRLIRTTFRSHLAPRTPSSSPPTPPFIHVNCKRDDSKRGIALIGSHLQAAATIVSASWRTAIERRAQRRRKSPLCKAAA